MPGRACYTEKKEPNTGLKEKTVLSLSYGKIVVKPVEKLHGLVPESFETYQIVDPGDIIIRPTDLQNDWNSLRFGLSHNRGIITSAYMCFRTKKNIDTRYGHLLLHTYDLNKVFYGLGSGLRQNLDWRDFKYLPCLVPPHYEQSAIVKFLEGAEKSIRHYILAKRKLIELLNEQKQAIVKHTVTQGIDPNVRFKPSGIEWLGNVPEHWELWQIGHFARIGNGSTPSRGRPDYWINGNYPWLNSASVNQSPIVSSKQFVTKKALQECHLPIVSKGSVLVAITGQGKTRGTAAVLGIEATINQHIEFVTPNQNFVSTEYLHAALSAAYRDLRRISDNSGSTKGALTCGDIRHFKILVPPLEEQNRLVLRIQNETKKIDIGISNTIKEIELIREYHARLISDVVTGKVDVRNIEILDEMLVDDDVIDDIDDPDDNDDNHAEDDNDDEANDK
jgi:type I restriction enzyme S subunit